MSDQTGDDAAPEDPKGVTAERLLADLRSTYAGVLCPIHGVAPRFDRDPKTGTITETLCCEALAQIFGELRENETP